MKTKAVRLAGLLLLVAGLGRAETLNPDKYPSLGLNWQHAGQSGDASSNAFGFRSSQDITGSSNLFLVNARYPVSDNWTLSADLGGQIASQTGVGAGSTSDASSGGVVTGLGVRYYFTGR